jgi:hypothetical protein
MPEIQRAHELEIRDPSDLFLRFPQGKNALPQLQLLALIAARVPSVSRRNDGLRLTPVVEKTLRASMMFYLIPTNGTVNSKSIVLWAAMSQGWIIWLYIINIDIKNLLRRLCEKIYSNFASLYFCGSCNRCGGSIFAATK